MDGNTGNDGAGGGGGGGTVYVRANASTFAGELQARGGEGGTCDSPVGPGGGGGGGRARYEVNGVPIVVDTAGVLGGAVPNNGSATAASAGDTGVVETTP